MRNQHLLLAGALLLVVVAPACAQSDDQAEMAEERAEMANERPREAPPRQSPDGATGSYEIINVDEEVIGEVELSDGAGGLLLKVRVQGLESGEHGFHLHETGRCEPPFESAGGHYDPAGRAHGFLSDDGPHAGDLPNLIVDDGQTVTREHAYAPDLSIAELLDADASALVIHAAADDYRTDPAGGAGDRVACAAITSS